MSFKNLLQQKSALPDGNSDRVSGSRFAKRPKHDLATFVPSEMNTAHENEGDTVAFGGVPFVQTYTGILDPNTSAEHERNNK